MISFCPRFASEYTRVAGSVTRAREQDPAASSSGATPWSSSVRVELWDCSRLLPSPVLPDLPRERGRGSKVHGLIADVL